MIRINAPGPPTASLEADPDGRGPDLPAVSVERLGKRYRRWDADRPRTLFEALSRGFGRLRPTAVFWALRDVSFRVARGELVGIVGANGAGKTTLLRLIGGVCRPDEGEMRTRGRVGGFLDFQAGMRGDLTGRENVFISGVLAGLTRREVEERFEEIVAFAEVEPFIDSPLRTYSSGMRMRLAFAVVAHTEPDILLIDEILTVGDLAFREKCLDRLEAFRSAGTTILLVSHAVPQARTLCDRVIWIHEGRLEAQGDPETVTEAFRERLRAERRRRSGPAQELTARGENESPEGRRFGTRDVRITALRLLDEWNRPLDALHTGEGLTVEISYEAAGSVSDAIFGVGITNREGDVCFTSHTEDEGVEVLDLRGRGRALLRLERVDLAPGSYFVNPGIYAADWGVVFDHHWQAYPLRVCGPATATGILRPPLRWELDRSVADDGA